MAKKIDGYIKLQIPAGQANPESAGRSRAGPKRSSTSWNSARPLMLIRRRMEPGFADSGGDYGLQRQVFYLHVKKTPPASILLKKIAGIKSGSGRPNTEKVGKVTRAQLEEVAKTKSGQT